MVLRRTFKRENVLSELFKRGFHVEAAEAADVNRLGVLHRGQNIQERLARGDALCVVDAIQLDSYETVRWRGMCVSGLYVRLERGNARLRLCNLARKVPCQVVFERVLLALEAGLEQS